VSLNLSISPSHPAGEGKGEGSLQKFSLILSLPLRERIKVRGAVKFFSSSFFPLLPVGEGKGGGAFIFLFLSQPCWNLSYPITGENKIDL
jgi:hypothetical protein